MLVVVGFGDVESGGSGTTSSVYSRQSQTWRRSLHRVYWVGVVVCHWGNWCFNSTTDSLEGALTELTEEPSSDDASGLSLVKLNILSNRKVVLSMDL